MVHSRGNVLKSISVPLGKVVLIAMVVAWCFGVLFNYYIVHKPFTAESGQSLLHIFGITTWNLVAPSLENLRAILNDFGNVGVAIALYVLAAAIGRRLLRRFEFASSLEAIVLRTGLGLGILSFATFALGLLGMLHPVLFWLLMLLVALLLRREFFATRADVSGIRLPIQTRFERALAWFIAASFLPASLVALAPTVAWDAQVYHLVAGKLALARGYIGPPPDNLGLSYPSMMEMLYLGAMTLKDDGPTALLHLGFLVLTLGAVLSFSVRYFTIRIGWIASAILCAVPTLVAVATWSYNDAALTFYAFAAFYVLMLAKERNDGWGFLVAGGFAGFALGEKYTAGAVAVALALTALNRKRDALRIVGVVSLGTLLTSSIWFVRNWIWEGNPFYPFFLGGGYLDAFRQQHHTQPSEYLRDPLRLLLVPWEATIYGMQSSTSFDATIGPLLLLLLPLLALTWRPSDKVSQAALIFSAAGYMIWLIEIATFQLGMQTRLFFYAFPLLALLAAAALERLTAFNLPLFSIERFVSAVVLLVLGLTLLQELLNFIAFNPLPYLVGTENRAEFLTSRLLPSSYYLAMERISTLPPNSRVLFLWEPRDYYASGAATTQSDFILDAFGDLRYRFGDAASIARALRNQGFTHVLLNRWGLNFMLAGEKPDLTQDDAQALLEFLSQSANQIYGGQPLDYLDDSNARLRVRDPETDAYALYALKASP